MLLLALSSVELEERRLFLEGLDMVDRWSACYVIGWLEGLLKRNTLTATSIGVCLFPLHSCSIRRNVHGMLTHSWLHTFVL